MSPLELLAGGLVLLTGILMHALEKKRPLTKVDRKRHLAFDITVISIAALAVALITKLLLSDWLQRPFESIGWGSLVDGWPMGLRILAGIIVGDFAYYLIHRSMHSNFLWRTHRFHHSTQEIWWFSGLRTSVLNSMFVRIGYLAGFHLFEVSAEGIAVAALLLLAVNFWVHANLKVSLGPLYRVLVTPRFHRIHHSMADRARDKNFGNIFSFWDFIFKTGMMPDDELDNSATGFQITKAETPRNLIGL